MTTAERNPVHPHDRPAAPAWADDTRTADANAHARATDASLAAGRPTVIIDPVGLDYPHEVTVTAPAHALGIHAERAETPLVLLLVDETGTALAFDAPPTIVVDASVLAVPEVLTHAARAGSARWTFHLVHGPNTNPSHLLHRITT